MLAKSIFATLSVAALSADVTQNQNPHATCADLKALYKDKACCGSPEKTVDLQLVPRPKGKMLNVGPNECTAHAPNALANGVCTELAVPQAGADVTAGGTQGGLATDSEPLTGNFVNHGLCPVNVHWHLGAEHRNTLAADGKQRFDESGLGPAGEDRRLAANARQGNRCYHYDANDERFTTEYKWQHCVGMKVGETYEVHWPHSKAGACGTPSQFQTPFYDGVFCRHGDGENQINLLAGTPDHKAVDGLATKVGVEAQVFTVINDEDYYYPDLMRGMIIAGDMGTDMAYYTGSTTGDGRNNADQCSSYSPITWQVDRKCHLISASTFDKMCADMKLQLDDMSDDLYPHGSRETVSNEFTGDNLNAPAPGPE